MVLHLETRWRPLHFSSWNGGTRVVPLKCLEPCLATVHVSRLVAPLSFFVWCWALGTGRLACHILPKAWALALPWLPPKWDTWNLFADLEESSVARRSPAMKDRRMEGRKTGTSEVSLALQSAKCYSSLPLIIFFKKQSHDERPSGSCIFVHQMRQSLETSALLGKIIFQNVNFISTISGFSLSSILDLCDGATPKYIRIFIFGILSFHYLPPSMFSRKGLAWLIFSAVQ